MKKSMVFMLAISFVMLTSCGLKKKFQRNNKGTRTAENARKKNRIPRWSLTFFEPKNRHDTSYRLLSYMLGLK